MKKEGLVNLTLTGHSEGQDRETAVNNLQACVNG